MDGVALLLKQELWKCVKECEGVNSNVGRNESDKRRMIANAYESGLEKKNHERQVF